MRAPTFKLKTYHTCSTEHVEQSRAEPSVGFDTNKRVIHGSFCCTTIWKNFRRSKRKKRLKWLPCVQKEGSDEMCLRCSYRQREDRTKSPSLSLKR